MKKHDIRQEPFDCPVFKAKVIIIKEYLIEYQICTHWECTRQNDCAVADGSPDGKLSMDWSICPKV